MTSLYGSYEAVTQSIHRQIPQARIERQVYYTLNRWARQLQCAYPVRMGQSTDSREISTPVQTDEPANVMRFVGKSRFNRAELHFVTFQGRSLRHDHPGMLTQLTYRWTRTDGQLLKTQQRPMFGMIDTDDTLDARCVIEHVSALELSFFNGHEWKPEWDQAVQGCLPQAVRISLTIELENAQEIRRQMTVLIACQGEPGQSVDDAIDGGGTTDVSKQDSSGGFR